MLGDHDLSAMFLCGRTTSVAFVAPVDNQFVEAARCSFDQCSKHRQVERVSAECGKIRGRPELFVSPCILLAQALREVPMPWEKPPPLLRQLLTGET